MSSRLPRPATLATLALLGLAAAWAAPSAAVAQSLLERTPLLTAGWVGTTGSLAVSAPFRFSSTARPDVDVFVVPTLEASLGLPRQTLAGVRYAAQSPLVPGRSEWEAFGRFRPIGQQDGAPLDIALQAGFNAAARSLDGELSLSRWMGGLRLIGAARAMSDGFGEGSARAALAAGAVLLPLPRSLPVAVSGDLGVPLARRAGEEVAWSGAVALGVPYAVNTLSVFATNTVSGTLQGTTLGTRRTRWGFELTLPVPVGRLLGWYAPRERAVEAVVEAPGRAPDVDTDIFRHAFPLARVEVPVGATVRWTNRDEVVHTVTADDQTWNSGAIPPGQSWSATFTEAGRYPFHCGPHPYMKGIVIVR